ncbi:outer membrane beta-barrel protein [Pedobacter sp. AW31-3R]|uniref:outer membrane beta-barrel protein n=1 Tax=Pedobacter sp. AW31-3R TaxID=3445781 RepID=UPI003F9EBCB3
MLLISAQSITAQTQRKLMGKALDSLRDVIAGADVYIFSDNDTLSTITDNKGNFSFSGFKGEQLSLMIMSVGFKPFTHTYTYKPGQLVLSLGSIVLKPESNLLDEVVIKARDNQIKIRKDTIEYDAAYYQRYESDRVEDLLRQIPGIEIDATGNVFTMGKPLLKLRVNGEDFFTSSVRDFIDQLPANVISKLQIINDYGDEANFTGIKGDSQKMLNLVTKDGQNMGTFGNVAASVGTNDRYGIVANGNLWQQSKQIGIKSSSNNTTNEAGVNTVANAGINYRDKLANGITASAAYNYGYNKNLARQVTFTETVNSLSRSIFNNTESETNSRDNNHNINFNIQSIANKSYLQASLTGALVNKDRTSNSNSIQTGQTRQDLLSNNGSNTELPTINANLVWARSMERPGRSLSAGMDFSSGINQVNETLRNKLSYYNRTADTILKDSLVNRQVETENRSNNLTVDFRYSEPLRYSKDSLIKRNIDFAYFMSYNSTDNSLYTRINNSQGNSSVVDSLSSIYSSAFTLHRFALNYRYQSPIITYSLGLTLQPSQLTGQYLGNENRIKHNELDLSPIVNLNYSISEWENLSFVYTGSSTAPDFYQLQPVPNISNLQNVVIGNPNLQSSFTHSGLLSYQHTNAVNGSILMMSLNGTIAEDQVVSNVVTAQDTLGSSRQETRFENANGAYSLGSVYSFSVPIAKNKFNAELRGTFDYNSGISYVNYYPNKNRTINSTHALRLKMNQRHLTLSGSASYSYSSNRYSIEYLRLRNIETWQFNLSGRSFVIKSFSIGADISKRINSGYAFDIGDPLLINMNMEKTLFKNKQATLSVHAYDLLKQGNNLNRMIDGNIITDSKFNQITRYFMLSFNYRLQNFGSKKK